MKKIQMVDLQQQYLKIKKEVDEAIADVIAGAAFIKGPQVAAFEKDLSSFLGVKHVIGCANGTDALQIALMALGLKSGDEVITPSFTFIATVETIALLGLKPVFAEADPDTFNISPDAIEKAITPRTKAILPVHLFGQAADMESILKIAEKHKLYILEDACQATGADYKFSNGRIAKAGTIGTIGCTSFFPSKNLGCFGDGGALFTNDDALAERIRVISNHGMKVRYYHDDIGVNSRLDSIQAAVLRIKLKHLNQYNEARRRAAHYYSRELSGIKGLVVPFEKENTPHIFHQYTLQVDGGKREDLRKYLEEKGIPAMIYYPVPIHMQKAYQAYGYKKGDMPVTEMLADKVLSLPMHTEIDEEQLTFITSGIT